MTQRTHKQCLLKREKDENGRRKTKTFELLEEAVQLITEMRDRIHKFKLTPRAKQDLKQLTLSDEEKKLIARLRVRVQAPMKGRNNISEFKRHAIRNFRQGLREDIDIGELSVKVLTKLRKDVEKPFAVIEDAMSRLDRFKLKAEKQKLSLHDKVDAYNKSLVNVKETMEHVLDKVYDRKQHSKVHTRPRISSDCVKTIAARSKAIYWSNGVKAATAVDIGDGLLLTCGHVEQAMVENGYKKVKANKIGGYKKETFDIYESKEKLAPIKPSNREPYAMIVERNGVFRTIPLYNPSHTTEAKIEGVVSKANFVDFTNDTIGGDSGAALIDINGEYVGMIVATSLGVRLPNKFFSK